jgi:hypothetical protein
LNFLDLQKLICVYRWHSFFNSLCPQKKIVVSVETLKPVKPVPASQLATESDVERVIKLVHSLLQELHLDGTRVNGFQVLERIFSVFITAYYFLKVHLHHFSKIKSQKESQICRNEGFSYYFCVMIEGSGSGSIPLTSGSGSGRPKTCGSGSGILLFTIYIYSTIPGCGNFL